MEKSPESLPAEDANPSLRPSSRNTFLKINTLGATVLATEVSEMPQSDLRSCCPRYSRDPSPLIASRPVKKATDFSSNLQGHGETKPGATKEKPRPRHTGDAGETSAKLSLKGPPGVTHPSEPHQVSTLERLDSTPRHPRAQAGAQAPERPGVVSPG